MISLNIFLVLLVLALAFFLFFKLLKGVIKAVIAVLFLMLFVTAILGIIVYFDVMKIKNSFDKEQTVLLSNGGNIVAGFSYNNNGDAKVLQSSKLNLIDKESLASISTNLSSGSYSSDNGLTFVVDSSEFYDTSLELADGVTINMTEQVVNDIFTCKTTSSCIKLVVNVAPALQKQIESSFENEQDLKNKVFFNLFAQKVSETKGAFIVSGIRNDKIVIYPSLMTIRIVKMMPEKLVDRVLTKTIENTTDSIEGNTSQ